MTAYEYEAARTFMWLADREAVGRPRLRRLQAFVVVLLDGLERWARTARRTVAKVCAPILPRSPGRHRVDGRRIPAPVLAWALLSEVPRHYRV